MEDSCTAGPPSRLRSGPAKETAPRVPDGVRREGQEFLNFLAAALPVFLPSSSLWQHAFGVAPILTAVAKGLRRPNRSLEGVTLEYLPRQSWQVKKNEKTRKRADAHEHLDCVREASLHPSLRKQNEILGRR